MPPSCCSGVENGSEEAMPSKVQKTFFDWSTTNFPAEVNSTPLGLLFRSLTFNASSNFRMRTDAEGAVRPIFSAPLVKF